MFKKALIIFALLFSINLQASAENLNSAINGILNSVDFDRDSVVSISVKDKNDNVIYDKSRFKHLNPASTLKLYTMAASMATLGEDYTFDTAFYKDSKNNYYLKLSCDPMLKTSDLEALAEKLKINSKGKLGKIYIDDSLIDLMPYPDGWAADDFWPNSPKISPYMLNDNMVKVEIYLNKETGEIRVMQKDTYRFSILNKLQAGSFDNIKITYDETHNTVNLEGTISSLHKVKEIPVLNPRYYFCQELIKALSKKGLKYQEKFLFAKLPKDAKPVVSVKRPIEDVIKHILATSDNAGAEIVFKVAGAKYAKDKSPLAVEPYTFGTYQNAINMFNDYYKELGCDPKEVKIIDGSGVSRYNSITTNWMSDALLKLNFDFKKYLPTAGEGTLSRRMREMKDEVYFKTGTLYGLSSLSGIIDTESGRYYYSSIIMGFNRSRSLIKGVEDEIIYEIYRAGNNEKNN